MLAHITAVSFGMDEKEINWYTAQVMGASDRRYYVATLEDTNTYSNTYIGKIDVSLNKHEASIYGFGVLPEYRGRGYGRQMLGVGQRKGRDGKLLLASQMQNYLACNNYL